MWRPWQSDAQERRRVANESGIRARGGRGWREEVEGFGQPFSQHCQVATWLLAGSAAPCGMGLLGGAPIKGGVCPERDSNAASLSLPAPLCSMFRFSLPSTASVRVPLCFSVISWQFNATEAVAQSRLAYRSQSVDGGRHVLLPPITFDMEFGGSDPRLVIDFMRSYERFGRALVWLDDGREDALQRWLVQRRYDSACRTMQWAAKHKRTGPDLSYSSSCALHISGIALPRPLDSSISAQSRPRLPLSSLPSTEHRPHHHPHATHPFPSPSPR